MKTLRQFLFEQTGLEFYSNEPLKCPLLEPVLPNIPNKFAGIEVARGTLQSYREDLFNSMVINDNIHDLKGRILVPNVKAKVEKIAQGIINDKPIYQSISSVFPNPIKFYHVGLIHQMESGRDFSTYLGNGQKLNKKTTIVPKGRGPFPNFKAGAIDAIKLQGMDKIQDWSIGNTLYILEGFNGYGYEKFKGIHSPYLWSGSNLYQSGYYVADSVYDKKAVSQQIGIALVYKRILQLI